MERDYEACLQENIKVRIKEKTSNKLLVLTIVLFLSISTSVYAEQKYLGRLSTNRYASDSTSNQYGQHGSRYSSNSVNNPYGQYGSQYSSQSVSNPYATNVPKIYASDGTYLGKASSNRYDPESISNPYGQYGSKYSSQSPNNPHSYDGPVIFGE